MIFCIHNGCYSLCAWHFILHDLQNVCLYRVLCITCPVVCACCTNLCVICPFLIQSMLSRSFNSNYAPGSSFHCGSSRDLHGSQGSVALNVADGRSSGVHIVRVSTCVQGFCWILERACDIYISSCPLLCNSMLRLVIPVTVLWWFSNGNYWSFCPRYIREFYCFCWGIKDGQFWMQFIRIYYIILNVAHIYSVVKYFRNPFFSLCKITRHFELFTSFRIINLFNQACLVFFVYSHGYSFSLKLQSVSCFLCLVFLFKNNFVIISIGLHWYLFFYSSVHFPGCDFMSLSFLLFYAKFPLTKH